MQVVRAAVGGARANRHSHRVAVDPYGALKALQQATVNLFSDMGIQPANLQRDLVPATASQDNAGAALEDRDALAQHRAGARRRYGRARATP
jgi:hypothetical protein